MIPHHLRILHTPVLTHLFLQDRNALPQARVQGLEDDIGLVGVEYNIVLSLTFIGYILMQGTTLYIPTRNHCLTAKSSSEQYALGDSAPKLVSCRMHDHMGYSFRC